MQSLNVRINLFTAGDSADINTWSNFPYFFSKALIRNGAAVNRINLIPSEDVRYRVWMWIWRKWHRLLRRITGVDRRYDFFRDGVAWWLANGKIRKEAQRARDADFNIFLTCSFSSWRYASTPVIHLCDSAYEHQLEDRSAKRRARDCRLIEIEKSNLANAHMVFATSGKCRDFLESRYRVPNAVQFNPGINLEIEVSEGEAVLLARKWRAKRILFIGKGIHKRGVDILVSAFQVFNERNSRAFELHIVGVSRKELGNVGDRVHFHGYLDKGNRGDLDTYCELLATATLFVMPMREGPLPGVVKEAALMYSPIIMSNIWNAGERVEHGRSGILVNEINAGEFAEQMHWLVQDRNRWAEMARHAHDSARRYSWDRGARELIEAAVERRAGQRRLAVTPP